MAQTELLFLGTDACIPAPENDTASYLINASVLIDVGWHVTENLYRNHHTPSDVQMLLFTHMHHDHMMSLPAFLYERYRLNNADELQILGPPDVARAVSDANRFLQLDVYWPEVKMPTIHVISNGETIQQQTLTIQALASHHAIPGFCYTITDTSTGVRLGFSGDTAYFSEMDTFFNSCDVLVHEFSWGARTDGINRQKHSSIQNAAAVAQASGAAMLCPVHGPVSSQKECDAIARGVFDGVIHWPSVNERMLF